MNRKARIRVAVIGGGAAGYFGSIAAAEKNRNAEVTLFEATGSPLDKVRISGGGRCNVTHACFDPKLLVQSYPRGNRELIGPFNRFQPSDTIDWFLKRGVQLKREDDGRMFPTSDSSDTIITCLKKSASDAGVLTSLQARVLNIHRSESDEDREGFEVEFSDREVRPFDRILLATGSSPPGYRIAE
ncbi:MAG TPA: NAD(P)/FAD-dependent oxidoreductase, partial [candidate division Zixibacteria bacterium]|nr:NAD(P)/FAD-dependent oxidoreductase [candidate division Zixibacteria bacterium]